LIPNWLGLFLFLNLVGCVLAAATAGTGWRSYALSAGGQVATGRVVRLVEDEPTQFLTSISPVVEFEVNGEIYSVRSQNSYGWWDRYLRFPVGRQVEVRYDPANPASAEINSLTDLWLQPLCLGLFTVIFALVVNAFLLARWRSTSKSPAGEGGGRRV
jgi:hypothetical protein